MKRVAGVVCLLLSWGTLQAATRVALVSSGNQEALDTVLDLAAVDLSSSDTIHLLERAEVERILTEQKLALSGLVDAGKAVAAGKVLSVELFAVVETSPEGKEASGLVVFDAGTGVRLWDAALPAAALKDVAEAAASGVRAAVTKHEAGAKDLRTVGLLSVRNADLPRDLDSACESLALILERRLLRSATVAVLERKRLEHVTQGKALPGGGTNKELLASLTVLDLEVSRGHEGKGLRATAVLTDSTGKVLDRVVVEGPGANPANLAEPLVEGILKGLHAAPATGAADLARESRRFVYEAQLRWSHKDMLQGLQAAESAYALDPISGEAPPLLAQYLMQYALELLDPGKMLAVYSGNWHRMVPRENLKTALGMGRRAIELRADAFHHLPSPTARDLGMVRNRYFQTTHFLNHYFFNKLTTLDASAYDDQARALQEEFRAAAERLLDDELEAWAEAVERDPKAFTAYTQEIQTYADERKALGRNQASFERLYVDSVRLWLKVARHPGITFQAWVITRYLQDLIGNALTPFEAPYKPTKTDLAKMDQVFKEMAEHPYPLIALYGLYGQLQVGLVTKQLTAEEARAQFQPIKKAALDAIQDPHLVPAPVPDDDLRAGCYKFLFYAIEGFPYPSGADKAKEFFDLCDFMLERREVVRDVMVGVMRQTDWGLPGVARQTDQAVKYDRRRWDLIQRAIAVADSPQCRLCEGHAGAMKSELREQTNRLLAAHPDFETRPAEAPWEKARLLLDVSPKGDIQILAAQVLAGDSVYVIGCGVQEGKTFLQLIRVPLGEAAPQRLGKAFAKFDPQWNLWSMQGFVMGCCVTEKEAYVATRTAGIFSFDLEGGPGRHLSDGLGLPSEEVDSLAFLDGKLYAGLGGGYLIALDPGSGRFEVLASSRRGDKLSPFDNNEIFQLPFLVADPARYRLLFLLNQGPHYAWYAPGSVKNTTSGLWEFDVRAHTFTRHLELFWGSLSGGPVRNDRLLLTGQSAALVFNLATNKTDLIWASYPPGPTLPRESFQGKDDYFPNGFPHLYRDGWLWTPSPFGRIAVTRRSQEFFPVLGKPKYGLPFAPRQLLEPIGSNQLAAGDYYSLWLLTLKK